MKKSDFEEKKLFGICPFVTTQQLLLGKWLIPILNELNGGKKRFSELQRIFVISQTTLSKQLKILEKGKFSKEEFEDARTNIIAGLDILMEEQTSEVLFYIAREMFRFYEKKEW